jgi:tripartite-type tricarboxylate transporter receptor subunit TctC
MKLRLGLFTCIAASALCLSAGVAAQAYPSKPVRIVVGYAPGGTVDFLARLVAPLLGEQLKQGVVVENRPGASGILGAGLVANAAPDGYTLLACATTELTVLQHVMDKLPYDPLRDFTPLVLAASSPSVLVIHPSVPANSAREFLDLARAKGSFPYGSPGPGSSSNIAFELLRAESRIDFVHIPYKGGAPATADLIGGQLPAASLSAVSVAAHIRAGKVKALAVLQPKRSELLPNVPTFKEATGFDINAETLYGFMAPANVPQAVVARLEAEILKILADPVVRSRLAQATLDVQAIAARPSAEWLRQASAYNENATRRSGFRLKLE